MQTLSKEAEERLIVVLKQATSLIDDDKLSPTDAIEKVARAEKWGADMIRFAAHAYNTGRQTVQRESSMKALDKFASFPLADPESVISRIFPATVKTAAVLAQETGIDAGYALPPRWTAPRTAQEKQAFVRQVEKAASCTCPVCGKDPCVSNCGHTKAMPTKPKTAEAVWNQHLELKKTAEEARHQAAVAYERMLNGMGRLADFFKKAVHDREGFEKAAFASMVYHGAQAGKLFTWVADRNKQWGREPFAADPKMAVAKMANSLVIYDPSVEPYNMVQACIDLAKNVHVKRAAEASAVEALNAHVLSDLAPFVATPRVTREWSVMHGTKISAAYNARDLSPFVVARRQETKQAAEAPAATASWSLLSGHKSAGNAMNWATGTMVGSGTKALLDRALGSPESQDEQVNDQWLKLEDPAHDAQLRQIRTQAMLGDLMNDDVISGYDPDRVAAAHNEIAQMAPRTAEQPLAMRTLLRRHLQGNMEPFEAEGITKIEKGIMDTHRETPNTRIMRETPQSILG